MKVWFPAIRGGSGTDVFTRRLSNALERRGIATEITWFPKHHEFAPFLLRFTSPPPGTQIIHTNAWNGFAFMRPGIPLVVTEHLNVLDPMHRPHKNLGQHIYHEILVRQYAMASFRSASAITAVSRFTASSLAKTLGVRSVEVIHNWIDTRAFCPSDQNIPSGERPFRLLFVGNLSRRKGVDLLAPIMKELGPKFELRFTSGLRQSNTIPMAQNMVPLGRLTEDTELVKAYQQCDALLFPSRFEGFGLAAVEAMACSKPVIAANTSSLPEVVSDGVTGILCPPDDILSFVAACKKLADNPETLRRLGQAARRRAVELFSEELITPRYVALYEKLAMK